MRTTYILRVWLSDRPGALGAVASRIGAVGGDVVGIEILERGAGRVIDELVVELRSSDLVDLLLAEVAEVDGVDVEDIRLAADGVHDPRIDALETAAVLVGAGTAQGAVAALCELSVRAIGAEWGAVITLEDKEVVVSEGEHPALEWLAAFVAGSQSSARMSGGELEPAREPGTGEPPDVVWAPLPSASLALVLGRSGQAFRARERRQVAALARIVDTRFRELSVMEARQLHPARRL